VIVKRLLIALAAIALVGGCVKVEKSLPKDLPTYVSIYPGAEPVVSIDMGAMMSVGLRTSASPDDVVAYYRAQAAANGLQEQTPPTSANASADQRQAMFKDSAGHTLVVQARPQNGETTIGLVYTKPTSGGS
jgi:hypothetical protein